MKGRWYLLLLAVMVLGCVGLAQTQGGRSALTASGLYEQPAAYTELAFTTPDALPSKLPKSGARVTVAFGIHNVSSTPHSYQWSIVLVHSGVSQVKAKGVTLTPAQGRSAVTRSVTAACGGGRVQVVIRTADPARSISFWLTCPPAPAKAKAAQ